MPKKGKKAQKILVIISRILGSLVIIGVIACLLPLSLPRLLGYETFNVVSASMEPELPVGSLIFVKQVDPFSLNEGDIITFYSNATVVSHRVTVNKQFERKLTTKGDANEGVDLNDVEYSQVIGIVKYHLPLWGSFGTYISSFSGKLFISELLICAMLLFVISGKIKL